MPAGVVVTVLGSLTGGVSVEEAPPPPPHAVSDAIAKAKNKLPAFDKNPDVRISSQSPQVIEIIEVMPLPLFEKYDSTPETSRSMHIWADIPEVEPSLKGRQS